MARAVAALCGGSTECTAGRTRCDVGDEGNGAREGRDVRDNLIFTNRHDCALDPLKHTHTRIGWVSHRYAAHHTPIHTPLGGMARGRRVSKLGIQKVKG